MWTGNLDPLVLRQQLRYWYLFAISRVMISQRLHCFSFKVIVPMLLACGHFTKQLSGHFD